MWRATPRYPTYLGNSEPGIIVDHRRRSFAGIVPAGANPMAGIRIGILLRWCSEALCFGLLYLLLTTRLQPMELALAGLAGLLAAALRTGVTASAERQFQRPRWRRLVVAASAAPLVGDCATVARRLVAAAFESDRRPGRFFSEPFAARGADAATATRRAEAVFLVSLAPNGYVVDVDEREDEILVHQLVPHRSAICRQLARLER
jgi:hypothetical protein